VRIVPPYYAAILVLLLVPAMHPAASAGDVVKQLLFLDWHTRFLDGSFWTLCVELRWYFIFPIALALWIDRPRAFWAIASASAMLYGMTRMHAPDVGTLLPFMLGIAAADLEIRRASVERYAAALLPVFVLCALVLERTASMPSPGGVEYRLFFVQTNPGWQLAAFAFVLLSARIRMLRASLSSLPLVSIGAASYSIYLVHEPIVAFLEPRLHLPPLQTMCIAYAAALLSGLLFWVLFERVWTGGAVKTRAVAAVEPFIARIAQALQAPPQLSFWEPGAATRIASAVPEGESAPA
jgi:exopolysaccharide production protein ExoZ